MKCEVKSNFIIKAKLIKRYKSLMDVGRSQKISCRVDRIDMADT